MTIGNIVSIAIAAAAHQSGVARRIFRPVVHKKTFAPFLVLALSAALYACGGATEGEKDSGTTKSAGSPSSKSASSNPWGSFKVGSFVKTKTTVSAQVMGRTADTSTESKTTLADLTADKAVLDIETTMMGNTTKTRTEVPLAGAVQTGAGAAGQGPNAATGTDTVVVAGKSLDCKTFEVETDNAGSKVKTKTWTSDQIPGFLVKSVSTSSGAMSSTTTMEVVDFKAN